jgi:DnaJ like chaperone protein
MYHFTRTHIGKIIAAFLGFLKADFLGFLIGLTIGFLIDKLHKDGHNIWFIINRKNKKNPNDVVVNFMVLASSLIKSSGKPIQDEELLLKKYLTSQIKDNERIDDYLEFYKQTKLKNWDIPRISQQLKLYNNHETNLQIIHNLFEIANFDNQINQNELSLIKVISIHLNIHYKEYEVIKKIFLNDLQEYYNILEIPPHATVQQIKDSHRKLALKYHPDKNFNSGDHIEYLNSKFQSIQHAFEVIKTNKGFI